MSIQPIFLEPVFKDRIWGGTKLRDEYGFDIPSETTGECWAVSAHPNGQSVVKNGAYAGQTLGALWSGHPELFRAEGRAFPLLIKILDASQDLSVQVHPDDTYASEHENGELGKTECWYVLASDPGAEIIFGHKAETKEQLAAMIDAGQWDSLLTRIQVRPGDFFYVPSGTIHALGKGIVVLETQQSSDTTYRVYDYDRRDASGQTRELHLDKAVEVTTVPHRPAGGGFHTEQVGQGTVTTYVSNAFFTVQKWDVSGTVAAQGHDRFVIYSVIEGSGTLICDDGSYPLAKGEFFILPAGIGPYRFSGSLTLIQSRV